MAKLTKETIKSKIPIKRELSDRFILCFKDKLQNGYTFAGLTDRQLKEWQNFLDIVSQLSFEQVERRYRRESDTNDTYNGLQVIHYGVGQTFRIHGVIENAQFVVLRIDPLHSFHK